jgi:hypothetical protein
MEPPELVDECGFADAGQAGNADAARFSGCGKQALKQAVGKRAMLRFAALDQRDGARQHRSFARDDAAGQHLHIQRNAAFTPRRPIVFKLAHSPAPNAYRAG